jgi:hypothetical protein
LSEELLKDYAPHQRRIIEIKEEISKHANETLQNISINVPIDKRHRLSAPLFNSSRPFKEQTERMDSYRSFKRKNMIPRSEPQDEEKNG